MTPNCTLCTVPTRPPPPIGQEGPRLAGLARVATGDVRAQPTRIHERQEVPSEDPVIQDATGCRVLHEVAPQIRRRRDRGGRPSSVPHPEGSPTMRPSTARARIDAASSWQPAGCGSTAFVLPSRNDPPGSSSILSQRSTHGALFGGTPQVSPKSATSSTRWPDRLNPAVPHTCDGPRSSRAGGDRSRRCCSSNWRWEPPGNRPGSAPPA